VRPIDLQDRGPRQVSPLELGLIELPSRPRSGLTVGLWRSAVDATSQGNLAAAADLTLAAMTESGYARGVLGSLVYGLWGLPMNFIGAPQMISDLVDTPTGAGEWRTMFPQPEAIRLMSWGITLGVGVGQMRRRYSAPGEDVVSVEEAADGTYKIRRPLRPIGANDTRILRTWDPRNLRHQYHDDTWWLNTADGEIRITPNDGEWILYAPYGEVSPWDYGAWKALTLAYILGRDAIFDRSRHAEVLAPMRVGTVPGGTTERQRRTYLRQLKEMQRMGVLILPPGLDYKVVESTGKIIDIYEQIIDWSQREYCLIFTGNETTTTGSKGFSSGDVQERIAKTTLKSFAGSFASCLHDGGLVEWSVANYGTPDAPLAFFDCDPPEDKLGRAKTVSEAGASLKSMTEGLKEVGLRLTAESAMSYAQSFGFAVELIPAAAVVVTKLDLAPTDIAKVFRADEIRASQGAGPIGDPRGLMTIPELDAAALAPKIPEVTPGAPLPAPSAPVVESLAASDDDTPPTDESAARLAAKMTEHAVERCGHGSLNRCLKCGVERDRDFDIDATGAPVWRVIWRPIAKPQPVVVPAALPTEVIA